MGKVTQITFENFKGFLCKKVEVEISCYSGGMMYPENNILVGMNEDNFYFLSEQGTDDEQYWHWTAKDDKDCSIRVWDYEEYKTFYEEAVKR